MATSIKDVEFSLKGESKVKDEIPFEPQREVQAVAQQNVIFKLVGNKRNGRVYVDGIDDAVMNPKTEKRERIWLLNSADSIWQSDLVELLKDKDFMRRNRRSLLFEGGVCRIPTWDDRALEFARACRHNIGSKDRRTGSKYEFIEYDPIKQQEEAINKEYFEIEMVLKARDMEVNKMKKLANFLGIAFNDDFGQYKGDDGIRRELIVAAKRNPKNFEKYLDSREVEIAYLVKKAIQDAKIDLTAQGGNAIWAGGKGFIAKIPSVRKPVEYLTELAMTNSEEGRNFKEQLEQIVT